MDRCHRPDRDWLESLGATIAPLAAESWVEETSPCVEVEGKAFVRFRVCIVNVSEAV